MAQENLYAQLEALLFVSDEPVSAAELAKIVEARPSEVDSALAFLAHRFADEERGIQLREVAGGWRLYSHPAYHEVIERYIASWDTRTLSQAALETLAIIAYHQPVTRSEINTIRGVGSEGVVSLLVDKGLVRETGRSSSPGNAIIYGTSRTFLERFGLKSLNDLPPLEQFAPDEHTKQVIRDRLSAASGTMASLEMEPTPEQMQQIAEGYEDYDDDDDDYIEELEQ
ncbi:MAG: SMC-Scp complex subunit ScpB [Coriobacteriia bacterium]|nr:SMC-Scp complex subunit ScpB [Coriobacteriia bacterium]MCL2749873.1 SMC-Scp complex subunit ScpB [Coriobacteriia bacterium]